MTPILTCPNCERSWSTKDCAAREAIICDCGKGIVVPDERSKAIAAASCATEAANELLAFAREGNQLGRTAFSISVGEKLADAFRLAIDAQGGPDDQEEALLYSQLTDYLDPARVLEEPQYEARQFNIPEGRWYLTRADADDTDEASRFLAPHEAKAIAALLNLSVPVEPIITPLPTAEEYRLAHAIVESDPVLRVYAACEWDSLDDNGKEWIAIIIREAQRQALQSRSGSQAHG